MALVTEYYVLQTLSECNGATCSEISPTPELDDKRSTYKMLEILEAAQLIKPAFRRGDDLAYSITPAGQYRLQQLRENLDRRHKAETDSQKQSRENRIWQLISITIGLLTLIATVLFGIIGLLR